MIIMLAGPARSGKDTVAEILHHHLYKKYKLPVYKFAFADKIRQDLQPLVARKYDCNIWDDSKKHLFRQDMIDYGIKKRSETNGRFLIDNFIEKYNECETIKNSLYFNNSCWKPHKSPIFIISDWRFINEYGTIRSEINDVVIPIYIQRYVIKQKIKYNMQPTIPQEIENFKDIKGVAYTMNIKWYGGLFWKTLTKYSVIRNSRTTFIDRLVDFYINAKDESDK